MTTLNLSQLKSFTSIDDPNATPMQRAIMHALDSQPAGAPDQKITDADLAAFYKSHPAMGSTLDAAEQQTILTEMETSSRGTMHETGNMALITAARMPTLTRTWMATDESAKVNQTTAQIVLWDNRAAITAGASETMDQLVARIKSEFKPHLDAISDTDLALKLREINGLGPNDAVAGKTIFLGDEVPAADLDYAMGELVNQFGPQVAEGLKTALYAALAVVSLVGLGSVIAGTVTAGGSVAAGIAAAPAIFSGVFASTAMAYVGAAVTALGATHVVCKLTELARVLWDASQGNLTHQQIKEGIANANFGGTVVEAALAGVGGKSLYKQGGIPAYRAPAPVTIPDPVTIEALYALGKSFGPYAADLANIAAPASKNGKNILIVSSAEGDLIASQLLSQGYTTTVVGTASEASALLGADASKFSAIITDTNLPAFQRGYELFHGLPAVWRSRVYPVDIYPGGSYSTTKGLYHLDQNSTANWPTLRQGNQWDSGFNPYDFNKAYNSMVEN